MFYNYTYDEEEEEMCTACYSGELIVSVGARDLGQMSFFFIFSFSRVKWQGR